MKKRILAAAMAMAMTMTLFAGCGTQQGAPGGNQQGASGAVVKVGMVTDSGTIDDKSFNQGTWEGITKYETETKAISKKYLQPTGEQETDYVNAIKSLNDTGYKIIVTPGFKFETAVNKTADTYKDATFILIDGQTHSGDNKFIKHDNVVCLYFAEQEAGFLAGVAAALSTKTGKLGFIGGMEIPPVQRYGFGFKAGVKYANDKFGSKAEIINYVYQGTFNDVAAGQTLAAGMYEKGADIIFHAAGGVGVGVFNEAKQRAEKGQEVYVVGVDVDQYELGKIKSGKSVTLTSALKRIDNAAYNYIDAKLKNKFPGGQVITLSLADGGVDFPATNPNLSDDTSKKVAEAKKAVLDKTVKVPATQADLDAFLK